MGRKEGGESGNRDSGEEFRTVGRGGSGKNRKMREDRARWKCWEGNGELGEDPGKGWEWWRKCEIVGWKGNFGREK